MMARVVQQLPSPAWSDISVHDHDNEYWATTDHKREDNGDPPSFLNAHVHRFQRQLGDSELSYYLPSRESGVNDMYLHLGFRASGYLVRRSRVSLVWAILRVRHPLLASKIEMYDYNDIRFVYTAHHSPRDALNNAENNMEYRYQSKDDLIDSYLNGPRTLSNDRLSFLIISQPEDKDGSLLSPPPTPTSQESVSECHIQDYELLICATHFLGDGMALHNFANDFFGLLGGPKSENELEAVLQHEWKRQWGNDNDCAMVLPSAMEDRFPPLLGGNFRRLASRVDFQNSQDKLIGGHSFPRRSGLVRRTIVPTVPINVEHTKKILKNCKAHGVSISSALFAICNIAWARTTGEKWDMPTLMYSALNLRPYLTANKSLNDSYWFLAVGYFNVILPTFLPRSGDLATTFWHRARLAKEQSTHAAKNPMVVSRSREMAQVRGERARAWAKEDDDKERGVWKAPPPTSKPSARQPSTALLGLSLLGNLDGIYKHSTFPNISLHTLTTGSRQRPGGMLLFGYTFAGKLWVSLGYDENGFEKDTVEIFWGNVLSGLDELLVS